MSLNYCQVCGQEPQHCICHVSIKPEAPKATVTPIKPTVKPEQVHVDLRFDPGHPTDNMLAKASTKDLKGGIVMGYDRDGNIYIDHNINDGPLALWLIEYAKARLMKGALE